MKPYLRSQSWLYEGSGRSLERAPGKNDNWIERVNGQLPRYVREVARSLHEKRGMTLSRAIGTAISRIKVWAVTSKDPAVKAKAAAAIAEWEALKAKANLKEARYNAEERAKYATVKRGRGKFPIGDKKHARLALAYLNRSDLSPEEKKRVVAKARRMLAS